MSLIWWQGLLIGLAPVVHYARRARDLEMALRDERLTVLSMELRPHFLLNALNTAAELVHDDPDAADQLIASLGHLLGHSLRNGHRHEVTLARELELLDLFVDVERARFGDGLEMELAATPDTLRACVPPLILQPLVENAVRHGIAPRGMHGTIRVTVERSGTTLRIDVTDNGVGFGERSPRGRGVGLANVRMRLQALYGARQSVHIKSQLGRGTQVTVRLPWRAAGPARGNAMSGNEPAERDFQA